MDYIRTGTYHLECAGGTGGCVDLDGSTSDAGVLLSTPFAITAGSSYTISFDLAGNGRRPSSDSVLFGFTGGLFDDAISGIAWDQPFINYSYTFDALIGGPFSFFIGAVGGDNFGPLLDNVLITSIDRPELPAVPLPATLPLLAGALGGLALWRRRKA